MIGFTEILFAVMSFVVTFTVARMLSGAIKKRRARRAEDEARKNQSRQVRRARQRKGKTPS